MRTYTAYTMYTTHANYTTHEISLIPLILPILLILLMLLYSDVRNITLLYYVCILALGPVAVGPVRRGPLFLPLAHPYTLSSISSSTCAWIVEHFEVCFEFYLRLNLAAHRALPGECKSLLHLRSRATRLGGRRSSGPANLDHTHTHMKPPTCSLIGVYAYVMHIAPVPPPTYPLMCAYAYLTKPNQGPTRICTHAHTHPRVYLRISAVRHYPHTHLYVCGLISATPIIPTHTYMHPPTYSRLGLLCYEHLG